MARRDSCGRIRSHSPRHQSDPPPWPRPPPTHTRPSARPERGAEPRAEPAPSARALTTTLAPPTGRPCPRARLHPSRRATRPPASASSCTHGRADAPAAHRAAQPARAPGRLGRRREADAAHRQRRTALRQHARRPHVAHAPRAHVGVPCAACGCAFTESITRDAPIVRSGGAHLTVEATAQRVRALQCGAEQREACGARRRRRPAARHRRSRCAARAIAPSTDERRPSHATRDSPAGERVELHTRPLTCPRRTAPPSRHAHPADSDDDDIIRGRPREVSVDTWQIWQVHVANVAGNPCLPYLPRGRRGQGRGALCEL